MDVTSSLFVSCMTKTTAGWIQPELQKPASLSRHWLFKTKSCIRPSSTSQSIFGSTYTNCLLMAKEGVKRWPLDYEETAGVLQGWDLLSKPHGDYITAVTECVIDLNKILEAEHPPHSLKEVLFHRKKPRITWNLTEMFQLWVPYRKETGISCKILDSELLEDKFPQQVDSPYLQGL